MSVKSVWLEKYREALLELDPEELTLRIEIAEKAIREQVEELGISGVPSGDEQHALEDALRGLRVVAKTQGSNQHQREYDTARNEVAS